MKNHRTILACLLSLVFLHPSYAQEPPSDLIPPGGQTQKLSYRKIPLQVTRQQIAHNTLNGSRLATQHQRLARSANANYAVGRTAGKLGVSKTGAAVYSIPIAVPLGIKGVMPKISLSYNSQEGDGIAGYGWNLSGLSTISRLGATPTRDGFRSGIHFDADDRLALDGQRLLLKNGTYGQVDAQYQTENQSNLKIEAIGDFQLLVTYPNGNRAWYGTCNSASQLEYPITRWQDPQGNFINYTYAEDDGVPRITHVQYGSNSSDAPIDEIKFNYIKKSRPERVYMGGKSFASLYLLSSIEAYGKGDLFRKYTLTYDSPGSTRDSRLGYDRLTKVQETDGSGTARPPTVFHYAANGKGISIKAVDKTQFPHGFSKSKDNLVVGEYDGNGKSDLFYYDKSQRNELNILLDMSDRAEASAYQMSVSPFDEAFAGTILSWNGKVLDRQAIITVSEDHYSNLRVKTYTMGDSRPIFQYEKLFWVPRAWSDTSCIDTSSFQGADKKIPKTYISGDFNGDGLTDVLIVTEPYSYQYCDACSRKYARENQGAPAVLPSQNASCLKTRQVDTSYVSFLDLNRKLPNYSSRDLGALQVPYTGNKGHLYAVEFDGDGKTDLLQTEKGKLYVYGLNKDNDKFVLKYQLDDPKLNILYRILLGDYNGDGKTDFIFYSGAGPGIAYWPEYLSTGNSYHYAATMRTGFSGNPLFSFVTEDINKDGKADLVLIVPTNVSAGGRTYVYNNFMADFPVLHNTGKTYSIPVPQDGAAVFWNTSKTKGSLSEIGYLSGNSYTSIRLDNNLRKSTKIIQIDEGEQLTQSIKYREVDDDTVNPVYTKDYSQTYPYININAAPNLWLVSEIQQTDGTYTRIQEFNYGGAVSHAGGLGFLGFKSLSKSNFYGPGHEDEALWTTTLHSPQLRGSPTTVLISDSSTSHSLKDASLSRMDYEYYTELMASKVFINRPTKITLHDKLKGTTTIQSFTYDDYGSPSTITTDYNGQGGKTQDFQYDDNPTGSGKDYYIGRLKQKTQTTTIGNNPFTISEAYTYESTMPNLPASLIKKGNGSETLTERYTYDKFGNRIQKTTDVNRVASRTTKTTYDPSGRFVSSQTDIQGLVTRFEHDPTTGMLLKKTDPFGMITTYEYDGWQRPKKQTDYLGNTTNYTYTPGGSGYCLLKEKVGTPNTRTYYNAFGQKVKMAVQPPTGSRWIATNFGYDDVGHLIARSQPYYERSGARQWDNFKYDKYGRLINSYLYTGKRVQTTYDGLTTTVNDGTKRKTTTRDAMGDITQVADHAGKISYTYYGNGEMQAADYGGYVIKRSIDQWGRKSEVSDPSAGTYTYKYDLFGDLLEQTTPKGKTTYTYDDYGKRLTKKVRGDSIELSNTYQYDPNTKLLKKISGSSDTLIYEYDKYNRLTSKVEDNSAAQFTKRYTYDDHGHKATAHTQTLSKASDLESKTNIRFMYDNQSGALTDIKDIATDASLWKLTGTNARGQLTAFRYGNGITAKYTYDSYGFPSHITHSKDNTTVLDNAYTFDAQRGNLTSRQNKVFDQQERFTYDRFDRLTSVSGDISQSQAYDPSGRITQNSDIGHYSYTTSNPYQLGKITLNDSGRVHYQEHPLQQITYNALMAPVEVYEAGHGRLSFDYNPMGSRSHAYYGSLDTDKYQRSYYKHYSADGQMAIVEDKKDNQVKFITWLKGDPYSSPVIWISRYQGKVQLTAAPYYLHRDYLGSILGISDNSGKVLERRHFKAWGELGEPIRQNSDNPNIPLTILDRGYTGHEHFPGVGLIHMNGRMYDPMLHRFLSPDNYIQQPFNDQDFNRYGYVLNNPLAYNDLTGERFIRKVILGGVKNAWRNIRKGLCSDTKRIGLAFFAGAIHAAGSFYGPFGCAFGSAVLEGTNAWLNGAKDRDIVKVSFEAARPHLHEGLKRQADKGKLSPRALKVTKVILNGISKVLSTNDGETNPKREGRCFEFMKP